MNGLPITKNGRLFSFLELQNCWSHAMFSWIAENRFCIKNVWLQWFMKRLHGFSGLLAWGRRMPSTILNNKPGHIYKLSINQMFLIQALPVLLQSNILGNSELKAGYSLPVPYWEPRRNAVLSKDLSVAQKILLNYNI